MGLFQLISVYFSLCILLYASLFGSYCVNLTARLLCVRPIISIRDDHNDLIMLIISRRQPLKRLLYRRSPFYNSKNLNCIGALSFFLRSVHTILSFFTLSFFRSQIKVVILVTPKQEMKQKSEWFCGVKFFSF